MGNFWKIVNEVIWDSDIILLLLDARMVEETRHKEIEDKVKREKKPIIYVVTKSDLVEKDFAEKYKKKLNPCVFVSAKEHFGMGILKERIQIEAAKAGLKNKRIKVGVLGYPNVGKSSLINSLKGKKAAPVSILSGYTKGVQLIRISNKIFFLDTPGVIPYHEKDGLKHAFIGTIDFTKARDHDMIVMELMQRFPGKIEKFYGVLIRDDPEETIEELAKKKQIFKKGGKPDIERMAQMILKDWQKGEIK